MGSIGSLPDPGFYSSPSNLPSGLDSGSAPSSAPSSTSSTSTPSTLNAYQQSYANLQQADAAELIAVSIGSADAAQSNVSNVLAQAAQLQQQQLAAQQAAAAAAASAAPAITAPAVPSYTDLVQQSDTNASQDLANGTLGSTVNTLA